MYEPTFETILNSSVAHLPYSPKFILSFESPEATEKLVLTFLLW